MSGVSYREFAFDLEPGERVTVARPGDFVVCLDASAPFAVSFDDGPETGFRAGLRLAPAGSFRGLALHNTDTAAQTVRVGVGRGDVRDSALTVQGGLDVRPEVASRIRHSSVYLSTLVSKEVVPADPDRTALLLRVRNAGGSAGFLRFGMDEASADAGGAMPCDPATWELTLRTRSAVWARAAGQLDGHMEFVELLR